MGWGSSTRRGGGRKVRALPRKFVFLGFGRELGCPGNFAAPPQFSKSPPPKTRNFMDMGFPAERTQFFHVPIKLAQPFPAPELRAKTLWTRGFSEYFTGTFLRVFHRPNLPNNNPDDLFLAFLGFPCFFALRGIPCFFECFFLSFPRILGVRKRRKILAFLVVFLAFSQKSKGK